MLAEVRYIHQKPVKTRIGLMLGDRAVARRITGMTVTCFGLLGSDSDANHPTCTSTGMSRAVVCFVGNYFSEISAKS